MHSGQSRHVSIFFSVTENSAVLIYIIREGSKPRCSLYVTAVGLLFFLFTVCLAENNVLYHDYVVRVTYHLQTINVLVI